MPSAKIVMGLVLTSLLTRVVPAQFYDPPDTDQPGDVMIHDYLRGIGDGIDRRFLEGIDSAEAWEKARPRLRREYFYMLGLDPMPEKTPLHPTITKTLTFDAVAIDLLHFQSRPGLYVTANLYRPKDAQPGAHLPAVLYVCGHSYMGRDGNKTAYQDHGLWFARHGYVCLVLDSLQLGEIAAVHHGTYRMNRWWWHSRGYTPAGVECWNGIRAIDYLASRPDVDAARIAVTGASGGGAASFWIAAADERVALAMPCMGMADLQCYVGHRFINGHCDCMFMYNTFEWPWTHIACLIAPRPFLFVNSDHDVIFPMDANGRISNRLERMYSFFGASDMVESFVSMGPHAYRKDIRQATYRFVNMHFKNDARVVLDSERDIVVTPDGKSGGVIPAVDLRVFPTDGDLPADQRNTRIDEQFVPVAEVPVPKAGEFESWKKSLIQALRGVSFRSMPEVIPAARQFEQTAKDTFRMDTEPGIEIRMHVLQQPSGADAPVVLVVTDPDNPGGSLEWVKAYVGPSEGVYVCDPRGTGETRWTRKNPPHFVERSHALLGRTVSGGRVWDVIATAGRLIEGRRGAPKIHVMGKGAGAVLAAYAALFDDRIERITLIDPPASHMDPQAPPILNVLRVCDIPDVLGMLAPRRLALKGHSETAFAKTARIYEAAGAADHITSQSAQKD